MSFTKITEAESNHDNLEQMSVEQLSLVINDEDQNVAKAVKKILPQINLFIDVTLTKMQQGGRLIYLGAGTSGRLGILDASECPPTFGVSPDHVIGLIAGGDDAIRTAVEGAEDNFEQDGKIWKTFTFRRWTLSWVSLLQEQHHMLLVLSKHVNLKESLLQLSVATQEAL